MLQCTIPAAQCRVKMKDIVLLSWLDTCASARTSIMEPAVIVSIILGCILNYVYTIDKLHI